MHDTPYRAQWDELTEEFREKLKRGIVAFEIAVDRVDGKFKLSQNRPQQGRASVLRAMERGGAQASAHWRSGCADWELAAHEHPPRDATTPTTVAMVCC
jgi:predicted FMN-binding regulatory protein PaiB